MTLRCPSLEQMAVSGHALQPDLIRRDDLPARPRTLPKPLSQPDDQLLQQELRRTDDLFGNAMLLTRATGIRIGECVDLPVDCLRQLAPDQGALYVPLGKLHTDRMVPVDEDVRRIVSRLLTLRSLAPATQLANAEGLLLPRGGGQTPNGTTSADLPGIRQSLAATHHLLEMYRRQLADEKTRRKIRRLDRRILAVASELDRLAQHEE